MKNKLQINDNNLGVIFILLSTLLLSFKSILVKFIYAEKIDVMDLFYYRLIIAVPLIWIIALYKKKGEVFLTIYNKKIFINCIFAGIFGYYLATLLDFHSLKLINANVNRIILYTFPVYVLLINSFLNKKLPSSQVIILFILIQISLFFVLGGWNIILINTPKLGTIFALLCAMSYAIYIIINQQTVKETGSILFATYSITFSFILFNIHYFFFYEPNIGTISLKSFILIGILAVFCTFIPLLLISEGIKRIGSSKFSLLNSFGPVITLFLCFTILEETMTIQQIIGSILVIILLYKNIKLD